MFLWLTFIHSMTSSHYMAGHGDLGAQLSKGLVATPMAPAHLPAWATHSGSVCKKEQGFTFITAAYP